MGVSTDRRAEERGATPVDRALRLSIVASGATSIITQVILLRELLSAFYGNELVLGIVLANWMLLTGAGSFLGNLAEKRRLGVALIVVSLLLIGVLPPITVLLFRVLRNIVFPVGGMIEISDILFSSFLLLMPYCLVSGFLFTLFALTLSDRLKQNLISRVYSFEAVGSIVGGLAFNLVMVYFLKTFQSLFILTLFDCGVAFLLARRNDSALLSSIVSLIFVVVLLLGSLFNIDDTSKALLFRGQDVLFSRDTPYGNLTVTTQGGQKNFYEDNVLLFSTQDVTLNEESVHYAMVQHAHPESVLLISGGISGMMQEILKYDVGRIDYVEVNPWLIEIGRRYTSALTNEKVRVINEDGRLFVRTTADRYDVVLINVPEPVTAQLNRFYTLEFMRDLKEKLRADAVICMSMGSSADYLSGEARIIRSILYNTVATVFKNILIVPGEKDYFLASDSSLDIGITRLIDQKNIPTVYVNKYYLDDGLLQQRSAYITSTLDRTANLNRDFTPVSYHRQMLYWLSHFSFNYWSIGGVIVILLALLFRKTNVISFGIFAGGFAASSIEVVLLISFQIVYGYVYQLMGLIVTIFMGGLALGSFYRHKLMPTVTMRAYTLLLVSVGVYAAVLPIVLTFVRSMAANSFVVHPVFFLLTCIIASIIGAQFSAASVLQSGRVARVASGLYGIDLVGSAMGALIVGAYLIPLIGIVMVCVVIAALSFTGGLVSFIYGGRIRGDAV